MLPVAAEGRCRAIARQGGGQPEVLEWCRVTHDVTVLSIAYRADYFGVARVDRVGNRVLVGSWRHVSACP